MSSISSFTFLLCSLVLCRIWKVQFFDLFWLFRFNFLRVFYLSDYWILLLMNYLCVKLSFFLFFFFVRGRLNIPFIFIFLQTWETSSPCLRAKCPRWFRTQNVYLLFCFLFTTCFVFIQLVIVNFHSHARRNTEVYKKSFRSSTPCIRQQFLCSSFLGCISDSRDSITTKMASFLLMSLK